MMTNNRHKDAHKSLNQQRTDHIEQQKAVNRLDCPGKTELHPDILRRSSIFVEYPEQTRIEGEIQQLAPDHPVTELWEVITGKAAGRTESRQITLFDSVGFAIEDFSALRYIRDRIVGTPFFKPLDLLADPDDPRDLFGMLARAAPSTAA